MQCLCVRGVLTSLQIFNISFVCCNFIPHAYSIRTIHISLSQGSTRSASSTPTPTPTPPSSTSTSISIPPLRSIPYFTADPSALLQAPTPTVVPAFYRDAFAVSLLFCDITKATGTVQC